LEKGGSSPCCGRETMASCVGKTSIRKEIGMRPGATNSDASTTRRDWRDLKPGDVIRFATGWYEVFDAYPIARDTVLVKLAITPGNPGTPGRIETHRVRGAAGSRA